jgi:hypothetical protein
MTLWQRRHSMKFALERVTQPDIEPVTLAEMIQHMREFTSIPQAAQDELTRLTKAAREWAEDYTGRALIDQTWKLSIGADNFNFGFTDANRVTGIYYGDWFANANGIMLRKAPAIAIISFTTVNADGTETVVSPTLYEIREANSKWPRLVGLNGSTWNGCEMRITFRAGFANRLGSPTQGAEVVPERFKQAIKLHAEAHYDRDEKMMQILLDAAEGLLKPERSELGMA